MANKTTNYNNFQLVLENRPIKPTKLISLEKKMKDKPFIFKTKPILCNSKEVSKERYASCDGTGLGIIDGQHRFTVGQQLGRPIYYIVDDYIHLNDIAEATSETTPWTLSDFLHMYCVQGKTHYKAFSGYVNRSGFPVTMCQMILQGGKWRYEKLQFTTGNLECNNWDRANAFEEAINGTDEKAGIYDYLKFAKKSAFLHAYWIMYKHPEYEHSRFMKKLDYLARTIVNCPNWRLFLKELQKMYNHNSRDKVRFLEED